MDALEQKLGHSFSDPELLKRALTHASANAHHSNERLEFLGDRVLGLIVAEKLHTIYPDDAEGVLTRRLHSLVRWEACAEVGEKIGLWEHLRLSKDSSNSGIRSRGPLVGSACEALIAALYFDGGMSAARNFVERYWSFENLNADNRDPKTRLQEWAQAPGRSAGTPVYVVVTRDGPDHAPLFVVEVSVSGLPPERGEGGSKREAEQDAAAKLLVKAEGV